MINRKLKFFIVDVFGTEKYSGNQLAVFTDPKSLSDSEMQKIAREINFSETTFITHSEINKRQFDVRIFTPGNEVAFAGHPTLGTASVIFNEFLKKDKSELFLHVKAGRILVTISGDILWMEQIQPVFGNILLPNIAAQVLQLDMSDINTSYPVEVVSTGLPFYIVPLNSLDALKRARVSKELVATLMRNSTVKEFLIFCTESYNTTDSLAVRVFVDEFGIPEDPATGSANGCLSAYLVKHKYFGGSSIKLSIAQGYEIGRPSRLYISTSFENKKYCIRVGGKVDLVAEGFWY